VLIADIGRRVDCDLVGEYLRRARRLLGPFDKLLGGFVVPGEILGNAGSSFGASPPAGLSKSERKPKSMASPDGRPPDSPPAAGSDELEAGSVEGSYSDMRGSLNVS
jgi:hypothetical protein